jgi:heparosan-N-sulfate-glucuronate 5-epimerase
VAPAILDAPVKRVRKFLSADFGQPLGSFVGVGSVRGYYIDLRVKAIRSDWPGAWQWAPGEQSWIPLAQIGLGAHERWLAGDGEEWLALARSIGDMMTANQVEGGARDGAWEQGFDLPHTYDLRAPWISAMAQGEGASLLVRLHLATGEDRYAAAALRAIAPLAVPVEEGGTSALLDGRPFPQEYPTSPPSFVLNGGMFAMWGLYDVGLGLGQSAAAAAFEDAVDTLAATVHRWDTGRWSLYDLYPHPIPNWSSFAYHQLHASQLRAMAALSPRLELTATAERFERYSESTANRVLATAHKATFRLLVPRNQRLARLMPGGRR